MVFPNSNNILWHTSFVFHSQFIPLKNPRKRFHDPQTRRLKLLSKVAVWLCVIFKLVYTPCLKNKINAQMKKPYLSWFKIILFNRIHYSFQLPITQEARMLAYKAVSEALWTSAFCAIWNLATSNASSRHLTSVSLIGLGQYYMKRSIYMALNFSKRSVMGWFKVGNISWEFSREWREFSGKWREFSENVPWE